MINIIIGVLLGLLLERIEKNKSFDTKTSIFIGIIGTYVGNILFYLLFSIINIEKYSNYTTWFISTIVGVLLTFYLFKKIKNTKLNTYIKLYLFKLSPFVGVISLFNSYLEISSANLVNASIGVLYFFTLFILFSIFVIWGIIKFFNDNNYFKNRYIFLFIYSFPIIFFLLDKL